VTFTNNSSITAQLRDKLRYTDIAFFFRDKKKARKEKPLGISPVPLTSFSHHFSLFKVLSAL